MTQRQPMTFAEFDARYTGKRYEYVGGCPLPRGEEVTGDDGEPTVPPKPIELQMVIIRATYHVAKHVLEKGLGAPLTGETGFFVTRDPPELRSADFAFLSPERAALCKPGEWLPFPPDFAFEVVTEWDSDDYIRRKSHSIVSNGGRLWWLIYPTRREVEVYRPNQPVLVCGINDTLDGGEVLAGFNLPVRLIFTVPDGSLKG